MLTDLAGKRVNVGAPGSGTQTSIDIILKAMDMGREDFALVSELRPDEHGPALCDNQIDAFFYGVGHPSANIADPTTTCGAQIVPITGEAIDGIIADRPFYASATIPGGTYANNEEDVQTFGVLAALAVGAETPDEAVYALVSAVFENFDAFKSLHPALANLNPENMVADGLEAPLHPGAEKFYSETLGLKTSRMEEMPLLTLHLAGDRDTLGEQPVLPCGVVELEALLDLRGGDVGHETATFRQ